MTDESQWEDVKDEWSAAIEEAYPTRSGSHDEYATAMQMVGNRHSKSALVALVNWLLVGKSRGVASLGCRSFASRVDGLDDVRMLQSPRARRGHVSWPRVRMRTVLLAVSPVVGKQPATRLRRPLPARRKPLRSRLPSAPGARGGDVHVRRSRRWTRRGVSRGLVPPLEAEDVHVERVAVWLRVEQGSRPPLHAEAAMKREWVRPQGCECNASSRIKCSRDWARCNARIAHWRKKIAHWRKKDASKRPNSDAVEKKGRET